MFKKETYIERRRQLKKAVGNGVLLFLGNEYVGMNYADNEYPFRQDSSFLYFFGSNYAGLAAIIDIDADKEIIFGNELTIDDIVWTGIQPTIREKSVKVGIAETRPMADLKKYLDEARKRGEKIHFLPPYRGDHRVWLQELLGILPAAQPAEASLAFIKAVIAQRIYKSAEEIAEIEKAVDVSADMHIKAMQMVRPGMNEQEIAAAITQVAMSHGCSLSFPIIATVNGQTLHNHVQGSVMKDGQMLLLDAGAENAMCYCGDLSSTMPVGAHFDARQQEVFNILYSAHRAAVEMLAPGVRYYDVHVKGLSVIAQGMKDLGLMKGDPVEATVAGATAMFMPCGIGHMMGLDVHDMENLGEQYVGYEEGHAKSKQFGFKSLRLARPLEPGFVFTVEPGIYFIPELMDKWRAEKMFTDFICYDKLDGWKDFSGIRNEEDYLITPTGARRLGKYKPMTIDEVEAQKK